MASSRVIAGALMAAVAMFGAGGAAAADGGNWSIGVSGGTLGISPEIGYRFNSHVGLRANGGFFDYERSDEVEGNEFDGTLKLNSFGAMADFYPFGGSFRISAGVRSNSNKIELVGDDDSYEIGDFTFTSAEVGTLRGEADFKNMAPTASLGWGGTLARGFSFGFEIGLMMQGAPRLSLTSTGGTQSSNGAFQAELAQERAEMEEDIEDYKFWPVIQLHFKYRF
jgi:hypothetical protein